MSDNAIGPSLLSNGMAVAEASGRHPEPVSGSIAPFILSSQAERWMLKRVQHDENTNATMPLVNGNNIA